MLCINNYGQKYIDECRARIDEQLSAYQKLAGVVRKPARPSDAPIKALESFEPVFFNNLVIVLDGYFVHRSRTIEKKEGNPLNEVRVLCTSMMESNGVMTKDNTIKLDPGQSVLGHQPGDNIRLREQDFVRLAEAFFTELERKFL